MRDGRQGWTIAAQGRTRELRPLRPTGPVTAQLNGRDVIVAASNDYLGLAWSLATDPIKAAGGSGGSRLISGDRLAHHQLEDALTAIFGRPALVFTSGYHANLAVFSTVCEASDLLASDSLNHASIIDGIRLSKATKHVFPHGHLDAVPDEARLLVVEGLYSMDGDQLDLTRAPRGPWLAVDEAHSVGCIGPQGRGTAAAQGVEPDILIGTRGKGLRRLGCFVIGPPELKALLVNAGRSFIYTTGMPSTVAEMCLAGLQRATSERRNASLIAHTISAPRCINRAGNHSEVHILSPLLSAQMPWQLHNAYCRRGSMYPVFAGQRSRKVPNGYASP